MSRAAGLLKKYSSELSGAISHPDIIASALYAKEVVARGKFINLLGGVVITCLEVVITILICLAGSAYFSFVLYIYINKINVTHS